MSIYINYINFCIQLNKIEWGAFRLYVGMFEWMYICMLGVYMYVGMVRFLNVGFLFIIIFLVME